jgi:hypothetical protein
MLEGGDEGVVGELQHVYVKQDLDQSPKGPKANLSSEGKTRIISPSFFKNTAITVAMIVHLCFKSSIETLYSRP